VSELGRYNLYVDLSRNLLSLLVLSISSIKKQ
jgi:hypothetical protein